MIKTIAKVALPVDEVLEIKRQRLKPDGSAKGLKRICVVTGIHGDELEGQYVAYELQRRINEDPASLNGS